MELRQFKYYLAIVERGSLSRAAQHLYVAQSALSKQIAELESELGVRLLTRSRTGVAMTEAGKVFHEYALGITKQIGDAQAAVHLGPDSVAGHVVMALPQSASAMLALPLLRAATVRYPNVAFQLNEELTGNMTDQLVRGRVDLAVFTDAMGDDIAFTPLVHEDFVWLRAAHDPLAPAPGPITPAQAVARPLVLPGRAHGQCTRAVAEAALAAAGHPVRQVATEINSVQIVKSAVEAGVGPTIMPLGLAQREVQDGRLVAHRIAAEGMVRTLGLCVSQHLPATNAKRALAKLVVEVVGELCDAGHWPGARRAGRPSVALPAPMREFPGRAVTT